jgi:hypothetical protein
MILFADKEQWTLYLLTTKKITINTDKSRQPLAGMIPPLINIVVALLFSKTVISPRFSFLQGFGTTKWFLGSSHIDLATFTVAFLLLVYLHVTNATTLCKSRQLFPKIDALPNPNQL